MTSPPSSAPSSASSASAFRLAQRAQHLRPSVIREILKLTERPGVLSLAGGLPLADAFPVDALRAACDRVLSQQAHAALQYAPTEGFVPLREWVAADLAQQGLRVDASQVLITNGSQQALDLLGKVLINEGGDPVAVESPTYLGTLQSWAPLAPRWMPLAADDEGVLPEALQDAKQAAPSLSLSYLLPSYQNPTGLCLNASRREALVQTAQRCGIALVEDNPYGELWYDQAPPPALASLWPEGVAYLGSFSKVLVPGLRLGYVVAPPALMPLLIQAKQGADLHTSGFSQRVVFEALQTGLMGTHLDALRSRYRQQRDALQAALVAHMPAGVQWQLPAGGMFFWLQLPPGLDAVSLLPLAVNAGVAFVPGAPFFAPPADGTAHAKRCLRLSFVTLPPERLLEAVQRLAGVLQAAIQHFSKAA